MSKTPFEIRLELLNLAKNILTEKAFNERNRLEQDWFVKREICTTNNVSVPAFPKTPAIDEDEIAQLAKKLNDFVSNG
jgi:hypothetical protein